MNIPYQIEQAINETLVLVPHGCYDEALEQIQLFRNENPARPAEQFLMSQPIISGWLQGAIAYCFTLVLFFILDKQTLFAIDWLGSGRLHVEAVRNGEWWRLLTALTLHLDLSHLVGNLIFGTVFGVFAARRLGSGVAWGVILLAGALGNAMNAWLQSPQHIAVGASTAVFAALGLSAAYILITDWRPLLGWARRWSPLVLAIVLLTWFGTGNADTDIVAHLTGFLAGTGFGTILAVTGYRQQQHRIIQRMATLSIPIALTTCWWLAVGVGPR